MAILSCRSRLVVLSLLASTAACAVRTPANVAPTSGAPRQTGTYPWVPDAGDGTYLNPVILADYSDPDVIRDGDDYWLTASSFTNTPGLPILHSTDLVNWTIVGHALKNLPDASYAAFRGGCGVWAPSIRKHGGKFFIFYPTPDEGIFTVTADRPDGAWSPPRLLIAGKGLIDPCPLWDDDGKAYLVHAYAASRAGINNRLRVRPMAPDASALLGAGVEVYNNPKKHPTLEGPKFFKRDGYYYISAPAGGVEGGWQVIFRSRNVYGPYEDKVVLRQGGTHINGPHQGAIVDDIAGNSWFIHFQDADVYGRITHLEPVTWKDGWPAMGESLGRVLTHATTGPATHPADPYCGQPVLRHAKPASPVPSAVAVPATSDDFSGRELGLQWQWQANHDDAWASLTARPNHLRLYPQRPTPKLECQPNILGQKLPARAFTLETEVELSPAEKKCQAGLVVSGKHNAALLVTRDGTIQRVDLVIDDAIKESWPTPAGPLRLRLTLASGGVCRFSFAADHGGTWTEGAPTFQAVKGQWVGARVGLVARGESGFADFGPFVFSAAGR